MWIESLRIESLRKLDVAELEVGEGLVLLEGPNGAGKTSVLEAIHFLGYGRSFRSRTPAPCIRQGQDRLRVMARLSDGIWTRQLGFERRPRSWDARINGEDQASLASLVRALPVVCFEPESHSWVSGPAELRRRLLDWTVFHVEHRFHELSSRYRRALEARNMILRADELDESVSAWELVLADSGEAIAELRRQAWPAFTQAVQQWWRRLCAEDAELHLELRQGWTEGQGLLESLAEARGRDQVLGYTRSGPHRADLHLQVNGSPAREYLSRGMQKALALSLLFAQRSVLQQSIGATPVVLLDDFPSEIDPNVQRRALDALLETRGQAWLSGTRFLRDTLPTTAQHYWFHVEQGRLEPGALL